MYNPLMLYSCRGGSHAFANTGDLREDNDIKQEVIAKMLNVNQSTYSRYETGSVDIPISAFIRLAEYYNTSIDYLVGLTNEKKPYTRVK